jgi:hypothetical protein
MNKSSVAAKKIDFQGREVERENFQRAFGFSEQSSFPDIRRGEADYLVRPRGQWEKGGRVVYSI